MEFARHQFELAEPQDDGQTLLAHYQAYENATGKVHPRLTDLPPVPNGCRQLWADFLELHHDRDSSIGGFARIKLRDVKAWQEVRQVRLSQWEINAIRRLDDLWLRDFAPKPKADK